MFGRFNLYFLSYDFIAKNAFKRAKARGGKWAMRLEILGLVLFWSWFGAILYGCGTWKKALMYLLVSHIVTSPLHVQVRRLSSSFQDHKQRIT